MKSLTFICILVFCTLAPRTHGSEGNSVFGKDDRIVVDQSHPDYQWTSAIGRLLSPAKAWCTATLISEQYILTSQHCIRDVETNEILEGDFEFYTHYSHNNFSDKSSARPFLWGNKVYSPDRSEDWAILKLKRPLGLRFGFLSVKAMGSIQLTHKKVHSLGFSGDVENGEVLSMHPQCRIRYTEPGVLRSDCDTNMGSSGGPIVLAAEPHLIIGIDAASPIEQGESGYLYREVYTASMAGIHTSASNFAKAVQSARSQSARQSGNTVDTH